MKDDLSLYETKILSATELEHGKIIETALRRAVWKSLKPVAFVLAFMYSFFAVSHILVIVAASFFILSTTRFLLSLALILGSWSVVVLSLGAQPYLMHFGFAVFSATMVSVVFHHIHVRNPRDNYRLRLIGDYQRKEVEFLATHDFLTDLANRRLFLERLTLEIAHAKRADKKVGVLFCDLNDFKLMNDTYGHEFGDEFAVLVTNIETQKDIGLVKSKLDAACEAIELIGKDAKVRISIGTALFPDDAKDIDTLMEHADHDMYETKQAIKKVSTS